MTSGKPGGPESDFVTLARVLKTQGRRGEVAVEVLSDVPNRFTAGMRLLALDEQGRRREFKIEGLWPHKGLLVLELSGVGSISEAEDLVGVELQVPRTERGELEPGWSYVSDLAGCIVFDGDREIGEVRDVRFGAGEAPLLVVTSGAKEEKKEYEIPFAEQYLRRVDVPAGRIEMALPEGMLEVNAPLSEEEKQANAGPGSRERR